MITQDGVSVWARDAGYVCLVTRRRWSLPRMLRRFYMSFGVFRAESTSSRQTGWLVGLGLRIGGVGSAQAPGFRDGSHGEPSSAWNPHHAARVSGWLQRRKITISPTYLWAYLRWTWHWDTDYVLWEMLGMYKVSASVGGGFEFMLSSYHWWCGFRFRHGLCST